MKFFNAKKLTTFQTITIGFAIVIIAGSLLLMLPAATVADGGASFGDALFTSTSAVCVTGLVVHDTATYWSPFGQGVIIMLIQIGGMGVVTAAASIFIISGQRIGLKHRSTMQEALAAPKVGGIVRLAGFIIKTTFIIEFVGALLLATVFCPEFGIGKGLWYSSFHSVSAFCNAGFDLMGEKGEFSSLTSYSTDPVVNTAIMALIITGGIGFLTWDDMRANKFCFRKYRMQSKVIITVTLLLITAPFAYFFFFEFEDYPVAQRLCMSLFQSVTPRTAGFNTADMGAFTSTGQFITIMLMICGGSPGSTAGGIKTTTVAVLAATAFSTFKKKEEVNIFKRRIADETVRYALTIFMMYAVSFVTGGIVISNIENIPIMESLFETASAIGTVGLSLGITPGLTMTSKAILMALMFLGRVGGLTLVFSALSGGHRVSSKLPQEKITVG